MPKGVNARDGVVGGRAAAWLAWSLVALSIALLLGGMALSRAATLTAPDLPFGGETQDASVVVDLVTLLTFSVVGAIIASRHPRNTIGWLFCSIGVTIGLNSFAGDYAVFWLASGLGPGSLAETAAWFSSWAWILLTYVPTSFVLLLFPDGRLPSPRWWPVAWGAALGIACSAAEYALQAGPLEDFPQIANPYGVDGPIVGMVGTVGSIVAGVSMVAAAVSLMVRHRRAGREQRQQIKWLAYGGAVVVGTIFVGGFVSLWNPAASIGISAFALLGLPVFTGIAVVKHRLYDIDIIINRTLVYGSLTAVLIAIYVGCIILSQQAFVGLTGQESTLAVVVSTLAIATLFDPLRHRVQGFVDRRFYRRKYNARKTLDRFSETLRHETDLGGLKDDLVAVVGETVQPAHVSVWLRSNVAADPLRETPG